MEADRNGSDVSRLKFVKTVTARRGVGVPFRTRCQDDHELDQFFNQESGDFAPGGRIFKTLKQSEAADDAAALTPNAAGKSLASQDAATTLEIEEEEAAIFDAY